MTAPHAAATGRVRVIGSLNIDLTLRVPQLPTPGATILANGRTVAFGGKGGNQAVAAAILGAKVAFYGAVGADDGGASYRKELTTRGVEVTGLVTLPDLPTGSAVVLVDERGENSIVVTPGANDAFPGIVDKEATGAVTLMQLEVPIAALEASISRLPQDLHILNPAPMPQDLSRLARLLPMAQILVPNRNELAQLAGRDEPSRLAEVDACATALGFAGTLIVTLGGDGAMIYSPDGTRRHLPAPRVNPLDTSGAGDAFCGALASALAAGHTIDDSAAWAVQIASQGTQLPGAQLPADFTPPPLNPSDHG